VSKPTTFEEQSEALRKVPQFIVTCFHPEGTEHLWRFLNAIKIMLLLLLSLLLIAVMATSAILILRTTVAIMNVSVHH
jgi:hypothetical protein